eukprot:7882561-Pyramimonas_sp.AAC.1
MHRALRPPKRRRGESTEPFPGVPGPGVAGLRPVRATLALAEARPDCLQSLPVRQSEPLPQRSSWT